MFNNCRPKDRSTLGQWQRPYSKVGRFVQIQCLMNSYKCFYFWYCKLWRTKEGWKKTYWVSTQTLPDPIDKDTQETNRRYLPITFQENVLIIALSNAKTRLFLHLLIRFDRSHWSLMSCSTFIAIIRHHNGCDFPINRDALDLAYLRGILTVIFSWLSRIHW